MINIPAINRCAQYHVNYADNYALIQIIYMVSRRASSISASE